LIGPYCRARADPDPAVTTNGVLETNAALPGSPTPAYSDYPRYDIYRVGSDRYVILETYPGEDGSVREY
jgi:hypothetical protein